MTPLPGVAASEGWPSTVDRAASCTVFTRSDGKEARFPLYAFMFEDTSVVARLDFTPAFGALGQRTGRATRVYRRLADAVVAIEEALETTPVHGEPASWCWMALRPGPSAHASLTHGPGNDLAPQLAETRWGAKRQDRGVNPRLRAVGHVGLEPTTNGLKVRCSAN